MNKQGMILNIIVILGILVLFLMVILLLLPKNNDCLEEIAEDYCEDNNMDFVRVLGFNFILPGNFMCTENERSIKLKFYKFLEKEIEECKEKD